MLLDGLPVQFGHFRLESGHHSDIWIELEGLCVDSATARQLSDQLANRLRPYSPDAVCGPLNEGAFVALFVAESLRCSFTYAERRPQPSAKLFPVDYRLPSILHPHLRGKRVAIVNDVTSAGSAVRGTYADLKRIGAEVVVIGSLLVLGDEIDLFATSERINIEAMERRPHNLWEPAACPLCKDALPLITPAGAV